MDIKMISVRLPADVAHQFKVDARTNGETVQYLLSNFVVGYSKHEKQKRDRRDRHLRDKRRRPPKAKLKASPGEAPLTEEAKTDE